MDGSQFDRLVRDLGSRVTRRRVMGSIAAMAGVAGSGTLAEAARHKHCRSGKVRCGKKCVRGTCCPGKKCDSSDACECFKTVAGDSFCTAKIQLVECVQCNSDAEFHSGRRCVRSDLCAGLTSLCIAPCL